MYFLKKIEIMDLLSKSGEARLGAPGAAGGAGRIPHEKCSISAARRSWADSFFFSNSSATNTFIAISGHAEVVGPPQGRPGGRPHFWAGFHDFRSF